MPPKLASVGIETTPVYNLVNRLGVSHVAIEDLLIKEQAKQFK